MYLEPGAIEQVTVLRETEIGYMVGFDDEDGYEEVFLHKNEVAGEIEEGDTIDVFYTLIIKSEFRNNEDAGNYST